MTDVEFTLAVESRDQHGRRPSRRMRGTGRVPAVLYGDGKPAESISVEARVLRRLLGDDRVYSSVITLKFADRSESALIRDLQRHPYKDEVLHMDFLRVHKGEMVTLHVPVRLLNEHASPSLKAGGVLHRALVEVEIQAPVGSLPEAIEVDIVNLQVGESLHLSQLSIPSGTVLVALHHGDDKEVVSIHSARTGDGEEAPAAG